MWLVNAYMPCQPAAAKAFIQTVLGPQLVNPPGRNTQTVLLGDWNFVHNPALDRMRVNSANHTPTPNDRACPAEFAAMAPNMWDTFREKCPGRRACTHAGPFGGARLDRVYVCADMLPFVSRAGVMNVPEYFSDHRPVFVHIVAAERAFMSGGGTSHLGCAAGFGMTRRFATRTRCGCLWGLIMPPTRQPPCCSGGLVLRRTWLSA